MKKPPFQDQMPTWRVLLLGCIVVWLCICVPGIAWSETADSPPVEVQQEEIHVVRLEDGTVIELAEGAVIRRGKQPDAPDLWSIPAERPQLSLLFKNRQGEQLLLFITPATQGARKFQAVRIENGQEQWFHIRWIGHSADIPVALIFVEPWIYLGRGTWLEKMNPEDGTIVERYPVREVIQSLRALLDGSIEVQIETSHTGRISLRFQEGRFFPHIVASEYLPAGGVLFNRATYVMRDFVGTLDPFEYQGYLDLHRIKKVQLSPKTLVQWREFDLQEAETAYRKASQNDLANPYFTLHLALSMYYQDRQIEAEPYFQETMARSAMFWEESLRLGAICESLELTAWADAFYEQGTARYFQEAPAPPKEAHLDEVRTFFLQQQSSTLFANGQTERALHVLDIRRQIFPYTEGDNLFSRKYAGWLQRMGKERKAISEKQRIGQATLIFDVVRFTPLSFLSFLIVSILFLTIVILKNDILYWYEFFIVVIVFGVVDVIATLDLFIRLNIGARIVVHIVGLLGYISIIAFFRKRRASSSLSQWRTMLLVMTSSYIVLLRGSLPAYYLGYQISRSQLGGKMVENLFFAGFIGVYYWVRRGSKTTPSLRHFKLFIPGLVVFLAWGAWLHYWAISGITMVDFPLPWIDRGHPNWVAYMDRYAERASFRKHDVLFLQALVHHLNGDRDFAKQKYKTMSNDVRALNNLGVMVSDEEPNTAQRYFEQALKLDSDFAPALYNLGLLTKDPKRIEQAQALDGWKPHVYQKYAPDQLWIVLPTLNEWTKTLYWSRGGFWVKGILELLLRVAKPDEFFQTELQYLNYE